MTDLDGRHSLVLALCHEVGNLVAAIRLNAHLVDPESSEVELARASVEIDDCACRTRSLLALVRPLLSQSRQKDSGVRPEAIARGVAEALDEYGGRGVSIEVEAADGLPRVPLRSEVLHHLLVTFAYYAVEEARPRGRVRIRVDGSDAGVVFRVEDDGRPEQGLFEPREGLPTGRSLACEIAKVVLGSLGGGVEAGRSGDLTEIALTLPALE